MISEWNRIVAVFPTCTTSLKEEVVSIEEVKTVIDNQPVCLLIERLISESDRKPQQRIKLHGDYHNL